MASNAITFLSSRLFSNTSPNESKVGAGTGAAGGAAPLPQARRSRLSTLFQPHRANIARPPNPIDEYRDYITHLYLNGISRSRIQYKLQKHHRIIINLSTISRRIASWHLPRQQARTKESPELIEATRNLIFRVGLSEKQILSVLQRQGWLIIKRGLKCIRLYPDRCWVRRLNSDEERLALLEKIEKAFYNKLKDREPAEQPLVELGYEDEEGNDMEEISNNKQDGETSNKKAK
ncbi:hypothetical protein AUP68_07535 [Ilyonectria robusta]